MEKFQKLLKNCKFFLATGKNDGDEQKILNEILNSKFKEKMCCV